MNRRGARQGSLSRAGPFPRGAPFFSFGVIAGRVAVRVGGGHRSGINAKGYPGPPTRAKQAKPPEPQATGQQAAASRTRRTLLEKHAHTSPAEDSGGVRVIQRHGPIECASCAPTVTGTGRYIGVMVHVKRGKGGQRIPTLYGAGACRPRVNLDPCHSGERVARDEGSQGRGAVPRWKPSKGG